MYIYNTTINIDENAYQEWLTWMETHILEVLNTGQFLSAKLTEVLTNQEEGKTYSVQYTASSRENLDNYYKFYANELRNNGFKKFANKIVSFETELKVINEFFPTISNN